MYRPKTAPHQEKDVREKDILAPRIPANLSVSDLCAGSFNEDDVISVCRSENSMLEDLSADNVSIQQSVFDGCTFRRIAFHGLDVTDVRFVNCNWPMWILGMPLFIVRSLLTVTSRELICGRPLSVMLFLKIVSQGTHFCGARIWSARLSAHADWSTLISSR